MDVGRINFRSAAVVHRWTRIISADSVWMGVVASTLNDKERTVSQYSGPTLKVGDINPNVDDRDEKRKGTEGEFF